MIRVSVLIPTFRRPEGFRRAAMSVFAQAEAQAYELVAVDNSSEGAALEVFRELETIATVPFRWTHEPRPGVAHARNAALTYARGDLVAWLDDDEEAPPHWLASLLAVREVTGAQAVFGPVRASAPDAGRNHAFFERLYSRTGPATSGPIPDWFGIGNSLEPRALFDDDEFDTRANQTGGEDDALFASWHAAGAAFAWAADAWVSEHVSPERSRLAHGLKRAFAYGQGPCETAWADRHFATLARHMTIGVAQAALFGAASAIALAASRNFALAMLDRAARGAGKVFWFLEQRFYGEALARQSA